MLQSSSNLYFQCSDNPFHSTYAPVWCECAGWVMVVRVLALALAALALAAVVVVVVGMFVVVVRMEDVHVVRAVGS